MALPLSFKKQASSENRKRTPLLRRILFTIAALVTSVVVYGILSIKYGGVIEVTNLDTVDLVVHDIHIDEVPRLFGKVAVSHRGGERHHAEFFTYFSMDFNVKKRLSIAFSSADGRSYVLACSMTARHVTDGDPERVYISRKLLDCASD